MASEEIYKEQTKDLQVLVIRLSALGDVAMTIPAIYSVANTYPTHTFLIVTSQFASHLFINSPLNVHVIHLKKRYNGIRATYQLLRLLHRQKVDVVADLHNVFRSWIVDFSFWLRGKRVFMINKMRKERRLVIKNHSTTTRPFVQRYFDVFARFGLQTKPLFRSLFHDQLPKLPMGIMPKSDEIWVGIAPFASYRSKIYDESQMKELIDLLALHPQRRIFLFGAKGNEEIALKGWAAGKKNVIVVAGLMTLEQELSLMAHVDVIIAMDSANMHLASLVATRVISLWGSTTPACGFLGYNQSENNALVAGIPCQPCNIAGSNKCPLGHMRCTKEIAVQTILDKVISFISKE